MPPAPEPMVQALRSLFAQAQLAGFGWPGFGWPGFGWPGFGWPGFSWSA